MNTAHSPMQSRFDLAARDSETCKEYEDEGYMMRAMKPGPENGSIHSIGSLWNQTEKSTYLYDDHYLPKL